MKGRNVYTLDWLSNEQINTVFSIFSKIKRACEIDALCQTWRTHREYIISIALHMSSESCTMSAFLLLSYFSPKLETTHSLLIA